MKKKNIVAVLAAGSGRRAGTDIPKQYVLIKGDMILSYTVAAFCKNESIDEVIIVANSVWHDKIREMISKNHFDKVTHIIEGGAERYDSSIAALNICGDCNILIHDAARPLVSQRIISDVIVALGEYRAVDVGIQATDTIVETDESHRFVERVPERARLFHVQTPQGFDASFLRQLYKRVLSDPNFKTTDDCGVVSHYEPTEPIKIVAGDMRNIKITWAEDIETAKRLLENIV